MSTELFDELEAGELSVEFEGGSRRPCSSGPSSASAIAIAISTAFQVDGCALIDMAARIRPDRTRLQR